MPSILTYYVMLIHITSTIYIVLCYFVTYYSIQLHIMLFYNCCYHFHPLPYSYSECTVKCTLAGEANGWKIVATALTKCQNQGYCLISPSLPPPRLTTAVCCTTKYEATCHVHAARWMSLTNLPLSCLSNVGIHTSTRNSPLNSA